MHLWVLGTSYECRCLVTPLSPKPLLVLRNADKKGFTCPQVSERCSSGNLTHVRLDPNDPAGSSAVVITLFAALVLFSPESSCSQELLRRLPIWLSELFVLLLLLSSICLGERHAFLRLCVLLEGAPPLLMLRCVISSVATTGRFPDDPLPIMILIFILWLSQFSNLNQ